MGLAGHLTEIGGLQLHYSQAGQGRPLLLLHGLLGGSFCWRFNIEALAEKYGVYALDLPGAGLSDAPTETDCSMSTQADRAFQFIQKLNLRDLTVFGTSWGGAVALLLARSEEHTSELQSRQYLVCRLLLEKKKPGPQSSSTNTTSNRTGR